MLENKKAIIILHEIYGVNQFIKEQCQKYKEGGFAVFCPDLLGRPPFLYEESEAAYEYFTKNVGFQVYDQINNLICQIKEQYDSVFLLGFSIGATIAWKCCENALCSGIIACYGSRIRDYTDLSPSCPTLLIFAGEDSFDVSATVCKLRRKQNLLVKKMDAKHGFLDLYAGTYNQRIKDIADKEIKDFLNTYTKV